MLALVGFCFEPPPSHPKKKSIWGGLALTKIWEAWGGTPLPTQKMCCWPSGMSRTTPGQAQRHNTVRVYLKASPAFGHVLFHNAFQASWEMGFRRRFVESDVAANLAWSTSSIGAVASQSDPTLLPPPKCLWQLTFPNVKNDDGAKTKAGANTKAQHSGEGLKTQPYSCQNVGTKLTQRIFFTPHKMNNTAERWRSQCTYSEMHTTRSIRSDRPAPPHALTERPHSNVVGPART